MNIKRMNRRALLRGAGGITVGLPWLEFTAGTAQADVAPKRLVIVSCGHSVDVTRGMNKWIPPGADLSVLSPILDPLAPHKNKLCVVSNLINNVGQMKAISSNGHNYSSRSLLTCMPTKEALEANGDLKATAPECKIGSVAGGPSLEYFVANQWKDEALNLRIGESPGEHGRSFRMDTTADLGQPNPQIAFDRLFKAKPMAGMITPEERLRSKRGSILDAVKDSYLKVQTKVGAEDKARLQRHLAHIRQYEMNISRVVKIVCDNPKLNVTKPLPAASVVNGFERAEGRFDDAIAAAQMDVAVTALACQATRVAHLHFSNFQTNVFPWLNNGENFLNTSWHGVVHMDKGTDEERLRPMRWYMEVLGDLLTRLNDTKEGAGSLLDSTLVLWISSLRDAGHGTNDLPVVLAGGAKTRLKTGQHLKLTTARSLADLYVTMLNMLDIPAMTFGWNKGVNPANNRPFNNGPLVGLS